MLVGKKEGSLIQSFGLEDEHAEKILRVIEEDLLDGKCLQEILQQILTDENLNEEERIFSVYAAGFVAGRHLTLNEICESVGMEKFKYLVGVEGDDKDDCMYQ
jgi:hypothetical protein